MLARLRERRRHPPAAAAGPAAFEASERRAERGARCAEGTPRDARLSLDTVAMRRCRVHLCVSRGGGGAPSGASVHTGSTPHGRLQLRPSIVPFPADARRRLPPAAFPPSALPRPPPPPPLPLLLGSAVARRLPRFGLRRFGHRRFCRRPGSPVRKFVALANGLRDGRNVLGPAHSGFLLCMTWSMAAMGMSSSWRQRRRRRRSAPRTRQRVKERQRVMHFGRWPTVLNTYRQWKNG